MRPRTTEEEIEALEKQLTELRSRLAAEKREESRFAELVSRLSGLEDIDVSRSGQHCRIELDKYGTVLFSDGPKGGRPAQWTLSMAIGGVAQPSAYGPYLKVLDTMQAQIADAVDVLGSILAGIQRARSVAHPPIAKKKEELDGEPY